MKYKYMHFLETPDGMILSSVMHSNSETPPKVLYKIRQEWIESDCEYIVNTMLSKHSKTKLDYWLKHQYKKPQIKTIKKYKQGEKK